ncbi:hypothetical protein, partial [Mycobacterium sp. RTGN4]
KTGAAYLPIDPNVPAARLRFVIEDAAPVAVLTTAELGARLAGFAGVVLDVEDPRIEAQPGTALPAPSGDDVAYL